MAKRFQPMKEFGRTTKKPKLDVSISKVRPLGPTQSWPLMNRPSACGMANDVGGNRHTPSSGRIIMSHNLWDDDDDDVILLATQVAESQVAIKTRPTTVVTDITDSEITFSEFAPNVHATTSTQNIAVAAAPLADRKQHADMFDDDDDFVHLIDAAVAKPIKQNSFMAPAKKENDVFKKPMPPAKENAVVNNIPSEELSAVEGGNATARRQVASERQIKLLMERLDLLKNENAKLVKDLSDSKSKIESKDGEASLLRDELRHTKQQMQTLKMEKIFSAESAKTECKTKIAELTKRVEAKETELKLRNVEYSVLKMRHADETQRLEMSIRNATLLGDTAMDENQENAQCPTKQRTLLRLRGLMLHDAQSLKENVCGRLTALNAQVYEQTHERGTSKRQHTPFQQELTCMQTLVAQLQLQQQKHTWTAEELQAFSDSAIESVRKVFAEFWTYVHSLEFPKNCDVHPYHEHDLRLDKNNLRMYRNLHQPAELYEDERAPSLRRYIAMLGVLCQQLPIFAHQLLSSQHGEYALLQVAADAVSKLGFSREICAHFGVIESFATLLHVLLLRAQPNVPHTELLINLLKQLVFVRPSAWIFREVSYCLLEILRVPEALSLLCVNSDEGTFCSDRLRSLYRFSNDSCLLQVYAGLLEIAFPLNSTLHVRHFQLLCAICENHVRFVHYCFMNPPNFIHKLLPSYDDEDDDMPEESNQYDCNDEAQKFTSNSTCDSTTNAVAAAAVAKHSKVSYGRCECYTKLCLSVVTLLFQLLRQWMRSGQNMETTRVAEVSHVAVQLLYIIFCDNYTTRLFRYAEETTKHYLWLICEWWTENADTLLFNNVQKNFLRKLRSFHIMPKQLREEGNITNADTDLKEWHSLTNDKNEDNFKNVTRAAEKLKLIQSAGDAKTFFEGLKGYAFNFE